MKVHLIDGTYELFRAFFGAPRATAGQREVGATRALMRSIGALLADPDATHLGAAFDTVIESFRNALYPGYKTGAGVDPLLMSQFPLAEQALCAMGLCVWGMIELEADDALATAAHRLSNDPRVGQVVLCSPDKDLAQCVAGERVVLFDRLRARSFDEAGVIAKFGVPPASIPDYLALTGDAADGYPGVPRWGPKSASALLARYRHLEAIPASARDWDVRVRGAEALAESLRASWQDALLFRRLATLRTDAPIDASLSALAWRGPRADLAQFCADLGMGTRLSEELARLKRRREA